MSRLEDDDDLDHHVWEIFDPYTEDPPTNHDYGPFDRGWRTVVYPAGTVLETAVAAETVLQAENGLILDPATVRVETSYGLPTQAHLHVLQDVVALYGCLVITYRATP